jgi:phosphomannomutase
MATIKFGTDGWRARIAEDFTFANVAIVAQAVAEYVQSIPPVSSSTRRLLVGYDRRFLSEQFARLAVEVFCGNGIAADLLSTDTPTPLVSFEVKRAGLDGGIVITASHNPPDFNGFKFKAPFGGSATPAITAEIEKHLGSTPPVRKPFDESVAQGIARVVEPPADYARAVVSLVDVGALRRADGLVIVDSMHGTGGHWTQRLLSGGNQASRLQVETIRGDRDPLFGGVAPEPMPQNLQPLADEIRSRGAMLGLATDGDADRVGAMDERGEYINTHQILAILLLHFARRKNQKGAVVRTFSQSVIVRRIAEQLGFPLYETPIGFKHVADIMIDESSNFLIGGEESGGIGVRGHIPERDGILNSLLLLEAVIAGGKRPSELVRDIWREFGEFHFERRDLKVPLERGKRLVSDLATHTPDSFAGYQVVQVSTLDGTKLHFADESWILFRQSGTEPVLRVYCEATSEAKMKSLIDEGERLARGKE